MIRAIFSLILLAAIFNPITQAWLARQLVVDDGLAHSDVVVSLRGGAESRPRMEEAIALFHQGYAETLLLDLSSRSVYGHSQRELIADYLKQKSVDPKKVEYCENDADSTSEEAAALRDCFKRIGAKSAIVVTSEYHTRRASFIFRRVFEGIGTSIRFHPLYNKEYWDAHWWRERRWAKTMLGECERFVWAGIESLAGRLGKKRPSLTFDLEDKHSWESVTMKINA